MTRKAGRAQCVCLCMYERVCVCAGICLRLHSWDARCQFLHSNSERRAIDTVSTEGRWEGRSHEKQSGDEEGRWSRAFNTAAGATCGILKAPCVWFLLFNEISFSFHHRHVIITSGKPAMKKIGTSDQMW